MRWRTLKMRWEKLRNGHWHKIAQLQEINLSSFYKQGNNQDYWCASQPSIFHHSIQGDLLSGCFSFGVIDRTKSCGVINTSESPCSLMIFNVAKYRKILSGVE